MLTPSGTPPKPDEHRIAECYEQLLRLPGFLDVESLRMFHCVATLIPPAGSAAVLEIGVFCGRSLLGLGTAFPERQIVGVDPLYESFHTSPAYPDEAEFLSAVSWELTPQERKDLIWATAASMDSDWSLGLSDRLKLKEVDQKTFLEQYADEPSIIVSYVDGEHSYDAVATFVDYVPDLVIPGGIVIIDDYAFPGFPEIAEAIHDHPLFRNGLEPLLYFGYKQILTYLLPVSQRAAWIARLASLFDPSHYTVRTFRDGSLFASPRDMERLMREAPGFQQACTDPARATARDDSMRG